MNILTKQNTTNITTNISRLKYLFLFSKQHGHTYDSLMTKDDTSTLIYTITSHERLYIGMTTNGYQRHEKHMLNIRKHILFNQGKLDLGSNKSLHIKTRSNLQVYKVLHKHAFTFLPIIKISNSNAGHLETQITKTFGTQALNMDLQREHHKIKIKTIITSQNINKPKKKRTKKKQKENKQEKQQKPMIKPTLATQFTQIYSQP